MKKLLKKRILIPLAVAIAVAIAAGTAYALYTTSASTAANNVSSAAAPAALVLSSQTIDLSNLYPSDGTKATSQTWSIYNSDQTAWEQVSLSATATGDFADTNYAKYIDVTVSATDQGSPDLATDLPWTGTLADLMNNQLALTTMLADSHMTVTISAWLDATATNAQAGKSGTVTFTFNGQVPLNNNG